ncbi:MAG: XRE family transcriptional regulator [Pseudomonadota bacterium]
MKTFPSEQEIREISKKLEKVEGTKALPKNASTFEEFRFGIQQKFVIYKIEHKCTQKEMARKLGVDEAKVSKILNNRLDEFSTDRLITLY